MNVLLHCAMVGSSRSRIARSSFNRACSCGRKVAATRTAALPTNQRVVLSAAPIPLRRSREDTHRQSIGWLSASFGIDADHCWMLALFFASSSQERFIVDSFIPAHRSRYPPSDVFKNVQQTNVRIPLCENATMLVRMTVFITKPRADTSMRNGCHTNFHIAQM